MLFSRDIRIVLFVSTVGIALTVNAVFSTNERIRDWQNEFASPGGGPVFFTTSLVLEHHRLLQSMTDFVSGDSQTSKADVLDRLDMYWSRYELVESSRHLFDAPDVMKTMTWLPPDSHSEILLSSLQTLTLKFEPALQMVEQKIKDLQRGDYQGYLRTRTVLDTYDDSLATLQVASFERQRYLDTVQVELSEQLRSQLRNALLSTGAGIILLTYVFLLYLRQRHSTTENLRVINEQLRIEIHESERLAKQLCFQATHDSLSGLVNRFGFSEALEKQLKYPEGNHGLCFIDLDLFKVVNDTCGHAAGDEVIIEISNILSKALPEYTTVARFGGDEFVILMCDCDQSAFENFIHECCSELKRYTFTHSGMKFDVSGSFGAAYFSNSDQDAKTQMGIADAACYEAKNSGGAQVHFHHGDDASFEARQHDLHVVAKIQTALAEQNFRLCQQPIVALNSENSDRPDHWEVLVRMVAENNELIMPGQFLDVAERYSLSPRIDRWVIEETFRWLNAKYELDGFAEFVNINLSGVSIGDKDFLELIEKLTLSLTIPASNVCFEITESCAMGKHAKPFLLRLKELGYQLALDDFGTGFSSFGYLESLPVDYIKIDGLFVRDMMHNTVHREFVKSINEIGKVMGKKTVAEYVECPDTLPFLKAIGVDFAQGYQIARPTLMTIPPANDYVVKIIA